MTAEPDDKPEITLMILGASFGRLWLGVFCTTALGVLLIWIVFAGRPAMIYQVSFLIAGLLSLWLAATLRRAGQDRIVLTNKVLRTESGRVLARVENVHAVERGAFAFKPPNGFLVRLKEPDSDRGWVPGLWWKRGRLVGVGGVVSAGTSRAMAETLTALTLGILPDVRAQ